MIHMQKEEIDIEFLNIDEERDSEDFRRIPSMTPFNDKVIDYFDSLSKILRGVPEARKYPDIATFAFYCRKANLVQMKNKFVGKEEPRLGRGLVFHIAPSNVPVNFAYSLLAGLLAGNSNIVRVPSKDFEQVRIIVDAVMQLSKQERHLEISKRIVLVRYDRTSYATGDFSSKCDVRIIWGGDETIRQIRENILPPRSFDITFADRYSICVVNADNYVQDERYEGIATGFFNDTYLMDQNACTSPHLLIWIGKKENVEKGKEIFWDSLHNLVKEHYQIQPIIAIDKLDNFLNQAVEMHGVKLIPPRDNLLWRVEIEDLQVNMDSFSSRGGYFLEYHAKNLEEISRIINRKYQTLVYYGISEEELENFVINSAPSGIDRIVPIGKSMDFSMIWDGYNLIESLSRTVQIIGK